MVKVSIEVRSGASRFGVSVTAASVRRALAIAGAWHPGSTVRVRFPREPGGSLSENPAALTGRVKRLKTAA